MARRVSAEQSELGLSAEGRWYHRGEPVSHPRVARFFHTCIRKDAEGQFYLHNSLDVPDQPISLEEHVYFELDGTAYFVDSFAIDRDAGVLRATLNTGAEEAIAPQALSRDAEGFVYARLSSGDEARFGRRAMQQLEPIVELAGDEPALRLGEQLVVIAERAPG